MFTVASRLGQFAVCVAALGISGCATVDYKDIESGSLNGNLFVMWVGEDKFVYAPDPADPLTFTRPNKTRIKPGIMYTDGGSIPKIAQPIGGFSPWGYAPAYMIHDWVFVGRHCIVDGKNDGRFDDVKDISFHDSAVVLGEVVKTLIENRQVPKRDFAPGAIYNAVDSVVARSLWDKSGACETIQAEHLAAVHAAMGGPPKGVKSLLAAPAQIQRLEGGVKLLTVRKAVPVAKFSFGPTRGR